MRLQVRSRRREPSVGRPDRLSARPSAAARRRRTAAAASATPTASDSNVCVCVCVCVWKIAVKSAAQDGAPRRIPQRVQALFVLAVLLMLQRRSWRSGGRVVAPATRKKVSHARKPGRSCEKAGARVWKKHKV